VSEPITVLQHLQAALRRACSFDRNDRMPPAALIWADKEAEWLPAAFRLAAEAPIYTLGEYDGQRSGPAIWLRCIVDRTLGEMVPGEVPIVYLPGYERSELRAVEDCPPDLQPIAELQYRGAFFGSRAGRDWTTTALFSNRGEGLGIEVARDAETEAAFARAMSVLLDEPVESLRQKAPLRAADLGALLDPDPVRTLLRWLEDPTFLEGLDVPAREEFERVAKDEYGFSPGDDGPIAAAERLGARGGVWRTVWDRFSENPTRYRGVVERLRQARPQELVVDHPSSWPQDNEDAERNLRAAVAALADRPAEEARDAVRRLEHEHGIRREWVWAALGQAPLARALEHLALLAKETECQLGGETPAEIAKAYVSSGWVVDEAALLAIASVDTAPDRRAVEGAVASLYRPWADASARRFQQSVAVHGTAGFGTASEAPESDQCILFTDGLRFDLGARLAGQLRQRGVEVELSWQLAALPSLTATAKPAVSPAASRLAAGDGFGTTIAETGQAVTAELLRSAIGAEGITVVSNSAIPDPGASGWTEFGNVDEIGHSHADRFPQAVEGQVSDIRDRVVALLESGWSAVRVVTDHGWLYLPGGLEKANLPEHLTVTRKGRAARLRDDAGAVDHPVVPWRWDPEVRVAMAPGLSCYFAGRVFEHGGLSPQECVTPVLRITRAVSGPATTIARITWVGMRVRCEIEGAPAGAVVDVRTKAASAATSKLEQMVGIEEKGSASALVIDPDAEAEAAFVVVLAKDGTLLAQRATTIGGE
jgi:hypothetical protein